MTPSNCPSIPRGVVLTAGVDLAAEPERTALAVLSWDGRRAVVSDLVCGVGDEVIVSAVMRSAKTGIDCPLGWPDAFVELVVAHRAGRPVPEDLAGRGARRGLAWRMTDEVVRRDFGLVPLSVAADRIGHAAFRCAGLLSRLAGLGVAVDRSGVRGVVAEVYPAASLKAWGLPHRGYKRPGAAVSLVRVVDALVAAAPWLDLCDQEKLVRSSHDALDAVIAALSARAAALGLASRPDETQTDAAAREGWIRVPTAPLSRLA